MHPRQAFSWLWLLVFAMNPEALAQESVERERFQKLSADFEEVERATSEITRQTPGGTMRDASALKRADSRRFARQFLNLAREAKNECVSIDALVWVVSHAGWSPDGKNPEGDEAIRQIEKHYTRSDRIAGAIRPIALKHQFGERVLRKVVEENPAPSIRGLACLGLATNDRMMFQQVLRYQWLPDDRRDEQVKLLMKDRIKEYKKLGPEYLVSESERWLERTLKEFPSAMLSPEVSGYFPILSEDMGASAEAILRHVSEAHPEARIRQEAACALAIQQLKLAPLVASADEAEVASASKNVPGGIARVQSIDSRVLAESIDRVLRALAEHTKALSDAKTIKPEKPPINYYHLLMLLGTTPGYHGGADQLLRQAAQASSGHPYQSLARRSLALHLAGLAERSAQLRFAVGEDLNYWVRLLGEKRVDEIRAMVPDALNREARELAERAIAEARDVRGTANRAMENLRQRLGRALVGSVAPEIEGVDLQGKSFKLSDYRGRVVLLDFWNHRTCPHCREAYPKLRSLVNRFEGQPFALLGVDSEDERTELEPLVKNGTLTWRFWFTHGSTEEPTFERWNIQGVPNVIVLDHQGVIRARYLGMPGLETLEKTILELIKISEKESGSKS